MGPLEPGRHEMRRKKRKPAKSEEPRTAPSADSPPQPDLQALNPGLLGAEDAGVVPEAAAAEGSVQDPLQDWPEAEGEADRWLLERPEEGEQVER
jgi:hypothetical protein